MNTLWKVLADREFKAKGEKLLEPYLEPLAAWHGPEAFPLPEDIYRQLECLSLIYPTVEHRGRGMCLGYQNAHGFFRFEVGGSDMTDYKGIMNALDDYSAAFGVNHGKPISKDAQPKDTPPKRCSTSNHFGSFLGHLQALRDVLKAAGQDGFCLDELMNALPEFEKAIQNK